VSPEQEQAWQQHRQAVARYSNWALSARVAVSTEDEAWNGRLHWRQVDDTYRIRFNAPTGQGAFQLDGDSDGVDMRLANGKILHDVDAETLLYNQLGWRLPLDSLRYWVTGLPAPGGGAELYFGTAGRLNSLLQFDWRIRYPDYRQTDGAMLPRKVYLENYELDLRLVIDRWELGAVVP
jgi:outer membrane lipoprotein LolB